MQKFNVLRKAIGLLLIMTLIMTAFVGCAEKKQDTKDTPEGNTTDKTDDKANDQKKDLYIGFAGMTLNNEFHITLANGAKSKAEELGIKIDIQAGDSHASAATQLQIIENYISNGVDGIIIVPSASEGLETALKKCKEAGIPVVNADTLINEDVVKNAGIEVPFYGTNNYEGAKLAGEYVKANFEKGTKTAILTGIEGHQNAADRKNGFIDGAGDAIEVVAEQSANWEVDQGYTAAQNIISANPDVKLFFASNDNMGIGALRAIQEADLEDQIQIIGFDAVSEALELVDKGDFLGTVAQFPAKMGEVSVENLVKMINGESYETYIDTGCKLIMKDNVAEHKEYLAQFAD